MMSASHQDPKFKRILTVVLSVILLATALIHLGVPSANEGDPTLQTGTPSTAETTRPSQTATDPTTEPTTLPPTTQPPTTEPPGPLFTPEQGSLLCRDYFVFDAQQDRFLSASLAPDALIYPASITKLFTAWVALDILDPDTVITAGDELDFVAPDSSIAYIRKGHRLTAAMLVEGMLLPSGNDAAYVLAAAAGRAVGGSDLTAAQAIACFVEQMNAQAVTLGLTGTHFTNPDGYHDPEHYTCAQDLVAIARLALNSEPIRRCVALSRENVTYASGQINTWHNSNLLVNPESPYYCPDAVGLKTGNTSAAGYSLLSAFARDGEIYIMGVFGGSSYNDRFADSLELYRLTLDALT